MTKKKKKTLMTTEPRSKWYDTVISRGASILGSIAIIWGFGYGIGIFQESQECKLETIKLSQECKEKLQNHLYSKNVENFKSQEQRMNSIEESIIYLIKESNNKNVH